MIRLRLEYTEFYLEWLRKVRLIWTSQSDTSASLSKLKNYTFLDLI